MWCIPEKDMVIMQLKHPVSPGNQQPVGGSTFISSIISPTEMLQVDECSLTHYVLNRFEETWNDIWTLASFCHFPTHRLWQLKAFLMEDKNLFILNKHNRCHGCWWPGNASCQGMSSNGIDPALLQYQCLSTRRVQVYWFHWESVIWIWFSSILHGSHFPQMKSSC